jgi:hypothetical protein
MHTHSLLALLSCAVWVAAAAGPAHADDGSGARTYTKADLAAAVELTPPVYTNADLAKFGPAPAARSTTRASTVPAVDEEAAWAFVQAALDREAARLEAERRFDLEREASRMEWMSGADLSSGYGGYGAYGRFAGYGLYGYGSGFGDRRSPFSRRKGRHPDDDCPPDTARPVGRHDTEAPLREFLSRRPTLHGQPPAHVVGHGRYENLKGSDAFPKRRH